MSSARARRSCGSGRIIPAARAIPQTSAARYSPDVHFSFFSRLRVLSPVGKTALLSLLLLLLGLLAWTNTLRNGFVYDDDTFIVLNPSIRSLSPLSKFLSPDASSHDPQMNRDHWRPLTTFSYALNFRISGLSPRAFHAANVALHLLNALLVFLLFLLLLRRRDETPGSRRLLVAFLTACVFCIHPLQTESVAWVSQRSNLLFLCFYLLALILHILADGRERGRAEDSAARGILLPLCALLSFAFSLLSKESAASLPLVLLGCEHLLRGRGLRSSFRRCLPYFAILALFLAARTFAIGQIAQTGYWAGGPLAQMLTMVKGFAWYVKLSVLPYPLSVEYLFPAKKTLDGEVLGYALVLAGILSGGWRLRKAQPLISFGIFLFFAALLPVSNILPIRAIINERFMYLPLVGFGLILGQVFACAWSSLEEKARGLPLTSPAVLRGIAPLLLATTLLAAYTAVSIRRNRDWKDQWSLVTASLKTCPQSAALHYGMGRAYTEKGMFEKAAEEFELSLRIDPSYAETFGDLDRGAERSGDRDSAIERYRQSIQKRVDFFDGLSNLGFAYYRQGDYAEAAKTLEKAVLAWNGKGGRERLLEVKTNLAAAYAYSGEPAKAIALSLQILAEAPDLMKARHNLEVYTASAARLQKTGRTGVTGYLAERFPAPEVATALEDARGTELFKTADGIRAREVRGPRAPGAAGTEFSFSEKIEGGYVVSHKDLEIKVRHAGAGLRPEAPATLEPGAVVYRDAYPDTDVLYVLDAGRGQSQEMLLLRSPRAPSGFLYEYSRDPAIDAHGELAIADLRLSRPLILDSAGRKIHGRYEKASPGQVLLAFDPQGLRYPLLIDPTWRTATSRPVTASDFYSVLLPDGRVLTSGGEYSSAMTFSTAAIFNPADGTWTTFQNMTDRRANHTGTLLLNGKVLVSGGWAEYTPVNGAVSTAELYDPQTGLWSSAAAMSAARYWGAPNLLPDGKVLVTEGRLDGTTMNTTAEVYDPAVNTWSATTGLSSVGRTRHSATRLADGRVITTGDSNTGTNVSAEIYTPATNAWTTTGSLSANRSRQCTILLPNTKVLIAGGTLSTAQLYDPSAGTWGTTGPLSVVRSDHSCVLLPNGKALAIGGSAPLSTAELYDPTSGTWSAAGSISVARGYFPSALLPSGKVLAIGGFVGAGVYTGVVDIYEPTIGSWSTANAMSESRQHHSAALLPNGKVLVSGGWNGAAALSTAQLYDPASNSWSAAASMSAARQYHTATLLAGGHVLVAGGDGGSSPLASAALYHTTTGTWNASGSMSLARRHHAATMLADGRVLVTGGDTGSGYTSTAEVYNPAVWSWTTTNPMSAARSQHSSTLLPSGKILVAGGYDGSSYLSTAQLYDPANGTWATTNAMGAARRAHSAVRLIGGRVLVSGGANAGGALSTAEIYDPSAGTWSAIGAMSVARSSHTATLLPSGDVLVSGGYSGAAALSSVDLYSPITGWSTANAMTAARFSQTATLLPDSRILMIGGSNGAAALSSAETARYTEYDYLSVVGGVQPRVATINGSSSFPLLLPPGNSAAVVGSTLTGVSEGGNYLNMTSGNYLPHAYLQLLDSGGFAPQPGGIVDVSTSLYTHSLSSTGVTLDLPATLAYGYYQLRIISNAVPSTATIIQVSPPVPAAPAAAAVPITAVSSDTISVDWTSNGAAGYVAVASVPVTGLAASSGNTSSLATVAGLLPNTTYQMLVSALNAVGGMSPYTVLGTTATLAKIPLPAQNTLLNVYESSITVAWAAMPAAPPTDSAGGYRLEASTAADFTGTIVSSTTYSLPQSTLTVAGLFSSTTYYLRYASLNAASSPNYAAAVSTLTLASTDVTAPSTIVDLFSSSTSLSTQLLLLWSAPSDPDNSPLSGYYAIQYATYTAGITPSTAAAQVVFSTSGVAAASVQTRVLSGLSPNTTYYAWVFSSDLVNWSAASNASDAVTLASDPTLGAATFTQVWTSSIAADWATGSPANPSGTLYTVEASSVTPPFTAGTAIVSSATYNAFGVLDGLLPHTTYTFRVKATNADALDTAPLALGATSTLSVSPNASLDKVAYSSITVQWPAVACAGYLLEASTASDFSGTRYSSATPNGGATQLSVQSLRPNTTYYLRAASLNWDSVPSTYSVLAATRTLVSTVTWTGGGGNAFWVTSGNWDAGRVPQATDIVVINSNNVSVSVRASDAPIGFFSLTLGGASGNASNLTIATTVASGYDVYIYGKSGLTQATTQQLLLSGDFTMLSGSSMTHLSQAVGVSSVNIKVAGTFDLQAGATITVNGLGYAGGPVANPGSGPGAGLGGATNQYGGGGAGHGGVGGAGANNVGSGGPPYDSLSAASYVGSGGGGGKGAGAGGAGGGAVVILANVLKLNGVILSTGAPGASGVGTANSGGGGGGSGGTVRFEANSFFSGNGSIDVEGGPGGPGNSTPTNGGGGGGAGGRIVVKVTSNGTVCTLTTKITGGTAGGDVAGGGNSGTFWPQSLLPAAPDFSGAVQSTGSISWAWTPPYGATGERVFTDLGFAASALLPGAAASFAEGSLTPNTTYTRYVQSSADCAALTANSSNSSVATLANIPVSPAPSNVLTNSLSATWSEPAGESAGYRLDASTAANFTGTLFTASNQNSIQTSLSLSGLATNTTYYLRAGSLNWASVVNHAPSFSTMTACPSPTAFSYTDPSLTPGISKIRAIHINELRSNIATLRANLNLTAFSFTDPTLTPGAAAVRAVHISELRSALDAVYTACRQTAPVYTDPALTPGISTVRAVHINELRAKVNAAP